MCKQYKDKLKNWAVAYTFYYSYNAEWLQTVEYFHDRAEAVDKFSALKHNYNVEDVVLYKVEHSFVDIG